MDVRSEDYFHFQLEHYSETVVKNYFKDFFNFLNLDKVKRDSVLDIGCGIGYTLRKLYDAKFKNLYGLDLNIYEVRHAAKWVKECSFILGNGKGLPFRDGSFEIVLLLDVLEHVKEDMLLLNEINRVLKIRGSLVLITPNRKRGGIIGLIRSVNIPFLDVTHVREYSWFELKKVLRNSGFYIERRLASSIYLMPVPEKLRNRIGQANFLRKYLIPFSSPSFWVFARKIVKK